MDKYRRGNKCKFIRLQTFCTTNYRAKSNPKSIRLCGFDYFGDYGETFANITTNPALPKYCVGGTVSIAAAGGSNYSWSPATGLSVATGSPVVASGTISTTYSLTGTGTNGCTKTIAVPVTVNQDPGIGGNRRKFGMSG